ncbi:M23 family metallopeptidase [Jeotgalibacillus sp. R-1-5s-1]|uniref:M23 family metallopeptidase n=1 Tax=Jeotgalibacillus sp. R-1-5s-1 TaxID=2555897 RepID=UPI00106D2ABC|nr:M23 family metallopeptidase [Jeotgalibacillus sp. R-1-5s-1]TFD97041.1 M23 family metallopeptidase [Jeotgalibacillus sp. R-1-5s-1]
MGKLVKYLVAAVLLISSFSLAGFSDKASAATFIKPVNSNNITSPFGDDYLNGEYRYHTGIDWAAPEGEPVVASASGTVKAINRDYWSNQTPFTGYGNAVLLQHTVNGQTYETLYAHLSSINVSVGQNVAQGALVGGVGNTGYSFGNHLHFELHVGPYDGFQSNAVNPLPYLNEVIEQEPENNYWVYHDSFSNTELYFETYDEALELVNESYPSAVIIRTSDKKQVYPRYEDNVANPFTYSVHKERWDGADGKEGYFPVVESFKYKIHADAFARENDLLIRNIANDQEVNYNGQEQYAVFHPAYGYFAEFDTRDQAINYTARYKDAVVIDRQSWKQTWPRTINDDYIGDLFNYSIYTVGSNSRVESFKFEWNADQFVKFENNSNGENYEYREL